MNKIFLPTLKSIRITKFSLYPNGMDFKYNFVNGVNLIIGGNGLGKTTFVNLIKYGLIGLYKKDLGFIRRTYQDKSVESRRQLPSDYFTSRMNPSEENEKATITLIFKIKDTTFEITRSLYKIEIQRVQVKDSKNTNLLSGKVIAQHKYERLEEDEKRKYLQYSYEALIAKKSNLYSFDDFIFFINEILMFGENHKTILWDEDNELIQERISSKYFNDPELDNQREEAIRKAKYNDSLARHRSEDIRAINAVIDQIKFKDKPSADLKNVIQQFEDIKLNIDKQQKKLDGIHAERVKITQNQKINNAERNKLSRNIDETESKISSFNNKFHDELWKSLNPKYQIYVQNIKLNQLCPMCNQEMVPKAIKEVIENGNNCFCCKQKINHHESLDKFDLELNDLKKQMQLLYEKKQSIEVEVVANENKLDELDAEYKAISESIFNLNNEKRSIEHTLNQDKNNEESFELKAMMHRISELEKEKGKYSDKSKKERLKADEITNKIEEYNTKITVRLSKIFTEFAEKFLKVPCSLSYDDYQDGKGKRFVPIIDDKPRLDSQSLSESQRFFIDHSYRMSLLHFFYEEPTYFICETPDSSLDISYEKNAANVFLMFLNQANSLIITSNLNNSEFLDYIIDHALKINYVNLLEIGKKSLIQSSSTELEKILIKIKRKLDAKQDK